MSARRRHRRGQDAPYAVVDIGSAKMTALIARKDGDGRIEVLGIGHRQSAGIKAGFVVDMAAAEHALRATVDQAERLAGAPVEEVTVSVNLAPMASAGLSVALALNGAEITRRVLDRLAQAVRQRVQWWLQGQALEEGDQPVFTGAPPEDPTRLVPLHLRPVIFRVDEVDSVLPPLGLKGERIEMTAHLIAVPRAALANLAALVERAHLRVGGFVAVPLASGLGALTPEERELGAAVIDIGAGRTAVGVFGGGRLIHAETLPVAGHRITLDIAEALLVTPDQAERLKCLQGHAAPTAGERREVIDVLHDDGAGGLRRVDVPRAALDTVIAARVEEIMEMALESLARGGFSGPGARRVVLVGGGAQLPGVGDVLQRLRPQWHVRIGRPVGVFGLAEVAHGPAFAAAAGLLQAGEEGGQEIPVEAGRTRPLAQRPALAGFAGIGRWLKENF